MTWWQGKFCSWLWHGCVQVVCTYVFLSQSRRTARGMLCRNGTWLYAFSCGCSVSDNVWCSQARHVRWWQPLRRWRKTSRWRDGNSTCPASTRKVRNISSSWKVSAVGQSLELSLSTCCPHCTVLTLHCTGSSFPSLSMPETSAMFFWLAIVLSVV